MQSETLNTAEYFSVDDLKMIFGMFKRTLRKELKEKGRCEPHRKLTHWKECNNGKSNISPVPFNKVV